MLIRQFYLYVFLLLSLSVSAQQFTTLDWQVLPPVHTLPVVTEEFPLEDDFRAYHYHAALEYPEFQTLDAAEAEQLKKQGVTLPEHPRLETLVRISAHKGFLAVRFVPVVLRNGIYQRITSFKLSISRTPNVTRTGFAETRNTYTPKSVLSEGKFTKIRVRNDGIYQISYDQLRKMGFASPEKVKVYGYGGHLLSQLFGEHPADDLPQAPFMHQENSVLLYARGVTSWKLNPTNQYFVREQNFYSEYAYYFLSDREDDTVNLPVEASLPPTNNKIDTFDAYAIYEKDGWNWASTGRELYDDYDYLTGNTRQYSFNLPGITNGQGRIIAEFSAKSLGSDTSFSLSVNGEEKGKETISGITFEDQYYTKATSASMNLSWIGEKSENTQITITHNRPAGVSGRLNYITLNYTRLLTPGNKFTTFRSIKSIDRESTFVISGADASTVVWDVTKPSSYKKMEITPDGGNYTFTIPAGELREFVTFNPKATFETVEVVGDISNQNLHALTGVDMIILVPDRAGFIEQAQRLANVHRDKDKLTVEIVTATQVYNEFSSGTPDATAYRRLMKMLYDRSSSETDRPKYLLLFGDCSYDNRMLSNKWRAHQPSDFLLCYQSENSLIELESYVTDDYFGFLDDGEGAELAEDKLDIGIGRFPVRSVAEAQAAVDKTIAYMENKHAGPWKNTVVYLADDGDDKLHMKQAEILASYTEQKHPSFLVNRLYQDAYKRETTATGYSYKDASKRLLQLFDKGMLLVNFTGHGSTTAWTAENLLTADDIVKLTSPRLPLWITATCDFTRFDDVTTSAGELAFLNAKGGAIALFTTTRVVYASQNSTLNQAFIKNIFSHPEGKRLRLGDIMRLSKCDTSLDGDRNKLNFSLIGDPALTLAYPDYRIEIDEFAGPLTEEYPIIKAGSRVTVKGHILTPDGEPAHTFNGTVHPTVFDSEEEVKTLDNLGEGAFTYNEHNKVLFAGSDVVEQGQFEFTFPVPLDINYSDMQGMLNVYALDVNSLIEAAGHFDRFVVGGTDDTNPSNEEGPRIKLYLNTYDFVNGGKTNETPMFIAEIEDPDGINTVGNGIGHELSLAIDGSSMLTYSLNDYYTPMPSDYTRGTVRFSIPALAEGRHTLSFRAWDLLNNSNTETLDFEVVKGLRPGIISISCTDSPARDNTTFIVCHDRPGSELDIRISVYDFSGRELWRHTEQAVAAGQYHNVEWNLCDSSGGKLAPGIYLYRAFVSSGGGKESTKTQKILILAQ